MLAVHSFACLCRPEVKFKHKTMMRMHDKTQRSSTGKNDGMQHINKYAILNLIVDYRAPKGKRGGGSKSVDLRNYPKTMRRH